MPQIGFHTTDNSPSMEAQNDALRANAIAVTERQIDRLKAELAHHKRKLARLKRKS